MNANTDFFLETPTLGEIDWRWTSTPGTPKGGYFKIDILDAVKVTGAYGSKGIGGDGNGPTPTWFPGADLASSNVGTTDILDLLQVTSHYSQTFGTPPP